MTEATIPHMRWQARRYLAALRAEIVEAGLSAAAAIPGLAAMVDQHAAAVRDRVAAGLEHSAKTARVVLLASYASGVLESARLSGWTGPGADHFGWAAADWTSLRLMAVCALAERDDVALADLPPHGGQERFAA